MKQFVHTEGEVEIMPIGTRVADRKDPRLTGEISGFEYHEDGKLSAIPYRVEWDNETLAREVRGIFYFWATTNSIGELK